MKRRNFFSKIAKGLLGIGIVTALPTPEVEPVPEPVTETVYDLMTLPSGISPSGFTIIKGEYCIVDKNDKCSEMVPIDLNNLPPGIKYKNGKIYGTPKPTPL